MKVLAAILLALALSMPLAFAEAGADSIASSMVDTSNGNYYALVMSTLGVGVPNALVGSTAATTKANTGNNSTNSICTLAPLSATLSPNQTKNFTCWITYGPFGLQIPCGTAPPYGPGHNVMWSATTGSVQSIGGTHSEAVFTAGAPGNGYVYANIYGGVGNIWLGSCRASVSVRNTRAETSQQDSGAGGGTKATGSTATTIAATAKTTGALTTAARDNINICYCGAMKVSCTASAKELCGKNLVSCQAKYAWSGTVSEVGAAPSAGAATTASGNENQQDFIKSIIAGAETTSAYPGAPEKGEEEDIIGIVSVPPKTAGVSNNSSAASDYPGAPETAEDRAFGIVVDELPQ